MIFTDRLTNRNTSLKNLSLVIYSLSVSSIKLPTDLQMDKASQTKKKLCGLIR
jgi:hypothetical protein